MSRTRGPGPVCLGVCPEDQQCRTRNLESPTVPEVVPPPGPSQVPYRRSTKDGLLPLPFSSVWEPRAGAYSRSESGGRLLVVQPFWSYGRKDLGGTPPKTLRLLHRRDGLHSPDTTGSPLGWSGVSRGRSCHPVRPSPRGGVTVSWTQSLTSSTGYFDFNPLYWGAATNCFSFRSRSACAAETYSIRSVYHRLALYGRTVTWSWAGGDKKWVRRSLYPLTTVCLTRVGSSVHGGQERRPRGALKTRLHGGMVTSDTGGPWSVTRGGRPTGGVPMRTSPFPGVSPTPSTACATPADTTVSGRRGRPDCSLTSTGPCPSRSRGVPVGPPLSPRHSGKVGSGPLDLVVAHLWGTRPALFS